MKKYFLILFFINSSPVFSMEDAEYEKWIHNVYLKHYKDPISNSEWNKRIQNIPKQYKLKYKDNLWDLSGSFLKDSLYWSKLWVTNPKVENPHLIYKDNSIKFDPLALSQVNKSKLSVDIQDQYPNLVLPSNFSKRALLDSQIPSSLPVIPIFIPFDDEIDLKQLRQTRSIESQPIPFYLSDGVPDKAGEILGKDDYGNFFGVAGDRVILKLNDNTSIGSYFTVFKNKGKTGDILSRLTNRSNEYEIQVKGILKVISYIQGSGSLYKARVISGIDEMSAEDSIFKGRPPTYSFDDRKIAKGSGVIIGSPYKTRLFLTVGSVVFLNKGRADGLYKEAVFFIRPTKEQSNFFERPYNYHGAVLGKLKVIHVSEKKATAVILSAKDKIYVGDSFSGPVSPSDFELIEEADFIKGKELLQDFEEVEPGKKEPSLMDKEEDLEKEEPSLMDEDQELKEEEKIDFEVIEQEERLEDPEIEEDTDLKEGFEIENNEIGEDFELLEDSSDDLENLENYEEDDKLEDYYEIETLEADEELSEGKKEIKDLNKGIKKSKKDLEELEEDLEEKEDEFEELEEEILEKEVKEQIEKNEDLDFEIDEDEFSGESIDFEEVEDNNEDELEDFQDNTEIELEEIDEKLEDTESELENLDEELEDTGSELEELEEIDTL